MMPGTAPISRFLGGPRQTVELPSEEGKKDEIGKDGDSHDLHSGFACNKQTGNHANEPDHPEDYAQPPEASAKGRCPKHGHAEDDETERHEEAPYKEERAGYALDRLPQQDDRCLGLGRRRRSLIEVGDWGEGEKAGRFSHFPWTLPPVLICNAVSGCAIMVHSYDHISLFGACFDIPVSLSSLFQRIASIYDRS
jgi:hypothetical protein